jgi:hypothetical protein
MGSEWWYRLGGHGVRGIKERVAVTGGCGYCIGDVGKFGIA